LQSGHTLAVHFDLCIITFYFILHYTNLDRKNNIPRQTPFVDATNTKNGDRQVGSLHEHVATPGNNDVFFSQKRRRTVLHYIKKVKQVAKSPITTDNTYFLILKIHLRLLNY
jgi:hypothetical protein